MKFYIRIDSPSVLTIDLPNELATVDLIKSEIALSGKTEVPKHRMLLYHRSECLADDAKPAQLADESAMLMWLVMIAKDESSAIPSILSKQPPSWKDPMPVDPTITLTLHPKLQLNGFPNQAVEVRGPFNQSVRVTCRYSKDDHSLVIRPIDTLHSNTRYTVYTNRLKTALIDDMGNAGRHAVMEFQTMPLQPIRLVVQEVNSGEVSIISLVRGASLLFEAVTATAHAFGLSPSQVHDLRAQPKQALPSPCDMNSRASEAKEESSGDETVFQIPLGPVLPYRTFNSITDADLALAKEGDMLYFTEIPFNTDYDKYVQYGSIDSSPAVFLSSEEYCDLHYVNEQAGMYAIVGKMSEEEEAQLINALIQGLYDGQ